MLVAIFNDDILIPRFIIRPNGVPHLYTITDYFFSKSNGDSKMPAKHFRVPMSLKTLNSAHDGFEMSGSDVWLCEEGFVEVTTYEFRYFSWSVEENKERYLEDCKERKENDFFTHYTVPELFTKYVRGSAEDDVIVEKFFTACFYMGYNLQETVEMAGKEIPDFNPQHYAFIKRSKLKELFDTMEDKTK